MNDQHELPAAHSGEETVPLVPEQGYTQPIVPPLEESWPDFSYDDPGEPTLYDSPEATMAFGSSTPYPGAGGWTQAHTAPLPEVTPPSTAQPAQDAGVPYQQPVASAAPAPSPPYPVAAPAYPRGSQAPTQLPYAPRPAPPAPPAQSQPTAGSYLAPRPAETTRYEPYEPYRAYQPPAPVVYAYPAPIRTASEHPNAVAALVLGIGGLFFLPILAPVAWIVGGRGRREMATYPGRWAPSGSLTAGYILGIIGTLVWGLLLALVVFAVYLSVR